MSKSIFIKLLISSIFIVVLSTSFCMSSSYALGDIFSQGKGFLEAGNDISNTINTTELEKTSDYIYNTLLAIAIMVAIIVAMVLGIQFMAASADEKAKVKEALMPFVVGCIVVFGSFTIWKIVVNVGNKAESKIEEEQYVVADGEKEKLVCKQCGEAIATFAKPCSKCGGTTAIPESDYNAQEETKNSPVKIWCWDCNKYITGEKCPTCGKDGSLVCPGCAKLLTSENGTICPDCKVDVYEYNGGTN